MTVAEFRATQEELEARVRALQAALVEKEIDLAILNRNSDLYYYTGSVQPLYLLVPSKGKAVSLARKGHTRIAKEVHGLPTEAFRGTKDLAALIEKHGLGGARRVGYALDAVAYSTVARFQGLLGGPEIVDLSWEMRALRIVKSESEIAILAEAGRRESALSDLAREGFEPGMTELELSASIEHRFRLLGHGAMIRFRRDDVEIPAYGVCSSGELSLAGTKFDGICSGTGLSPAVPYGATERPIERGVPVILDYSFVLDGYHVDETRMFSWGAPSDDVLRAYDAMVRVEERCIELMRPGVAWEAVYNGACELAAELGYADTFMGYGSERVRFVGHGVGLELDEPPLLAPKMPLPLQAGMVVAVEPKVALPGVGVIGIEDTILVRDDSALNLTPSSPEFVIVDR